MRRGAYIIPKYLNGKPTDRSASALFTRLPLFIQRFLFNRLLEMSIGEMTSYGLPEPDHKLLEAHPTVSAELLSRLGHGDIAVKPNIDRFTGGHRVRFVDGSEEEIDLVIYCTGYKISFPFFDPSLFSAAENRLAVCTVESSPLSALAFTSSASFSPWARSCRSPRPSPNGLPTCSVARASYLQRLR